jgi:mRNA-degrading endonuclease toxin of MazEF toxin-antitoxin module
MNRGDVILVRFPHPSGARGKKRPAVVVQSDAYNLTVNTVVVAEVTKNLTMASDAACLFIDVNTPEGQATGLLRNSVVSCLLLATINRDRVDHVLGALSAAMANGLDECLRAGLGIA